MSYTYLQAQGEESSAESFSDIPQCVQWKSIHTAAKSYSNGNAMESCRTSQSGMMSQPLMAGRGKESCELSAVASRAKTSVLPEKEQASQANALDYGKKCGVWLGKYDPNTSLWKTLQCSLFGGLESWSETWPSWGMMHNGESWGLPMLERSTSENESGFLPTPLASDGEGGGICRSKNGREYNLRDWWANQGLGKRRQQRKPEFWEWVMGWPMGWTASEPLETDKFRLWLHSHGEHSTRN
jgi:hypothetical protein